MSTRPIPSASQVRQALFALLPALGVPGDVLPMLDAASAVLIVWMSKRRGAC